MIKILDQEILLSTAKTSYLLSYRHAKKLCLAYYGKKIVSEKEIPSLLRSYPYNQGTELSLENKDQEEVTENQLAPEVSSLNHGDYFEPSLILEKKKTSVFDFRFVKAATVKPTPLQDLPFPHAVKEECVITLADPRMDVELKLHYLLFPEEDVIARYLEILNLKGEPLLIHKAMSYEVSLVNNDDLLFSTYGNWAGEFHTDLLPLRHGRTFLSSLTGSSSARHNPFFMLEEKNCTLQSGNAYAFNLIYSGNHEESIEMDSFDNIRISQGISATGFQKKLGENESFSTPIGIFTFTDEGTNGIAKNMQTFVKEHIVPVYWKDRERPVIYNNWEATGMKFSEGKLVSLMKEAKKLGIELFVLDDGWFSTRNDDSHGLGDWEENKKLPGGIKSISEKAEKLGLKFGIWVEPEMVNSDTKLFKEHPDWIIKDNIHEPLQGRHQYTLNLGKKEVQDFVFLTVDRILSSGKVSYIKWDYNRNMSDVPGGVSCFHDEYIRGLYKVLKKLVSKYPEVLFENCASGGNRFDLGMLTYFSQSWMSDDTDSYQREKIQTAARFGYPLLVMSNHVAAKTSNQLLRKTELDTKFDIASFGVLGYELDLDDLFPLDKEIIKGEIAFYKAHRKTLQQGLFYAVKEKDSYGKSLFEAYTKEETIVLLLSTHTVPNPREDHLRALYLEPDALYTYKTRQHRLNIHRFGGLVNYASPIHLKEDGVLLAILAKHMDMKSEVDEGIASGSVLSSLGPVLSQEWSGVGYNERIRLMLDFDSREYVIEKEEEKKAE